MSISHSIIVLSTNERSVIIVARVEIDSVTAFQSKYKNTNTNDVLKNMNSDELKSFFIMNYNLFESISQNNIKYNRLLDENKTRKNKSLNSLENAYQRYVNKYERKNLHQHENELESKLIIKQNEVDRRIDKHSALWKWGLAILTYFVAHHFLAERVPFWLFFIPFVVSIILAVFVFKITNSILERKRENEKLKVRPSEGEFQNARAKDAKEVYSPEDIRKDLKVDEQRERIVQEFNTLDENIRKKYFEIHNPLKSALNKLQIYLPGEFHNKESVAILWKLLNDGYGENWKEIINIYREQKNFEGLQSGLQEIHSTLNTLNQNVVNSHVETKKAISQQNAFLIEINKGIELSNQNIQTLNDDMNSAYTLLATQNEQAIKQNGALIEQNHENHKLQKDTYEEVQDANPNNPYKKH